MERSGTWAAWYLARLREHPRADGEPWTHAEVARRTGIKDSYLRQLAAGRIAKPDPRRLREIARAVGSESLTDVVPPPPPLALREAAISALARCIGDDHAAARAVVDGVIMVSRRGRGG